MYLSQKILKTTAIKNDWLASENGAFSVPHFRTHLKKWANQKRTTLKTSVEHRLRFLWRIFKRKLQQQNNSTHNNHAQTKHLETDHSSFLPRNPHPESNFSPGSGYEPKCVTWTVSILQRHQEVKKDARGGASDSLAGRKEICKTVSKMSMSFLVLLLIYFNEGRVVDPAIETAAK